jgi:hypothetical protein
VAPPRPHLPLAEAARPIGSRAGRERPEELTTEQCLDLVRQMAAPGQPHRMLACLVGLASASHGAKVPELKASEDDRSAAPTPHAASNSAVEQGFEEYAAPPVPLARGMSGTGTPPKEHFGEYLHPVADKEGHASRGKPPPGVMANYVPPASVEFRP